MTAKLNPAVPWPKRAAASAANTTNTTNTAMRPRAQLTRNGSPLPSAKLKRGLGATAKPIPAASIKTGA